MAEKKKAPPMPAAINFLTGGLGGIGGWLVVHPFNTVSVRMNLATATGNTEGLGFVPFFKNIVKQEGAMALYNGLSAGITRQIFYATARVGFFDVIRDQVAKYREIDIWSRLLVGVVSGGMAAVIACPAEVSLVRMSNDNALPLDQRRNYKSVVDAAVRIARDDGITAYWRGCGPFVNRAMLVGACQVGTYDQFKNSYKAMGITGEYSNVFAASMTSGLYARPYPCVAVLRSGAQYWPMSGVFVGRTDEKAALNHDRVVVGRLYSVVTMPFETAKNRMAFQKPDPTTGILPYRSTVQTITSMAKAEGVFCLWNGFMPYYLRSGGHTVFMFMIVEQLRTAYNASVSK